MFSDNNMLASINKERGKKMLLNFIGKMLCRIALLASDMTLNSTCFFASYQPDVPAMAYKRKRK